MFLIGGQMIDPFKIRETYKLLNLEHSDCKQLCFFGIHKTPGLPWWLRFEESSYNARGQSWIPGLRGSPGEGAGKPFQYSCLRNPMDRGAWQATVHGITIGHNWAITLLLHIVNLHTYIYITAIQSSVMDT